MTLSDALRERLNTAGSIMFQPVAEYFLLRNAGCVLRVTIWGWRIQGEKRSLRNDPAKIAGRGGRRPVIKGPEYNVVKRA